MRIPRADISSNQLTTQTPTPGISDIGTFTQKAQNISELGRVLGEVANDFKRLQTLREVSKATIETNRQLTDLEERYLSDPGLTESSYLAYQNEAKSIVGNQLATIGDEETRLRSEVQFSGTALTKSYNIKSLGRQTDIDNAVVETDTITQQSLLDSFVVGNQERAFIRNNLINHLNRNVEAKLFTKEVAAKQLADFDESLRKGRADYMLNAVTSAQDGRTTAERVINAKVFMGQVQAGAYPELTLDEEQALITDCENFIKRGEFLEKQELEKAQEKNQADNEEKLLSFQLTKQQIKAMEIKKEVSESWATDALEYLKLAEPENIKTDNATYSEIFDMINGTIVNEQTGRAFTGKEIQERMLRAAKELKLAPEQFRELKKMRETEVSQLDKDNLANEVKSLRAWAVQIIAPTESFMTETSATKAKVDEVEVMFKRRVISENAKGARIREIAETLKGDLKNTLGKESATQILNSSPGDTVPTLFEGTFKRTPKGTWVREKKK